MNKTAAAPLGTLAVAHACRAHRRCQGRFPEEIFVLEMEIVAGWERQGGGFHRHGGHGEAVRLRARASSGGMWEERLQPMPIVARDGGGVVGKCARGSGPSALASRSPPICIILRVAWELSPGRVY